MNQDEVKKLRIEVGQIKINLAMVLQKFNEMLANIENALRAELINHEDED